MLCVTNYTDFIICSCVHLDEVYITYGNWGLCFYWDKSYSSAKAMV